MSGIFVSQRSSSTTLGNKRLAVAGTVVFAFFLGILVFVHQTEVYRAWGFTAETINIIGSVAFVSFFVVLIGTALIRGSLRDAAFMAGIGLFFLGPTFGVAWAFMLWLVAVLLVLYSKSWHVGRKKD